jgi:hypothetical protein
MADAGIPATGTEQPVGREEELASIAAFPEARPGAPRALVIRGPPGIGKTILRRVAVERLRERGFRVLVSRPARQDMLLALRSMARSCRATTQASSATRT